MTVEDLELVVRWHVEPTEWALLESSWREEKRHDPYGGLPHAFCPEVGRRMLLAQLEFSSWVLRRVEKVQFERDRSVSREIAIDLKIRADAPTFRDENDHDFWLVPISSMRRRTLVNLELRDESGDALCLPGIRLTQQLDQAMLLAAAATSQLSAEYGEQLREFVLSFVAGELPEVMAAWQTYVSERPPAFLRALDENHAFKAAMYLLHRNFTLYAFLPVSAGRQRLIRMSFDEPTDWLYRQPGLQRRGEDWDYDPGREAVRRRNWGQLLASFALRPTMMRLQTPGADKAASYHFEIVAPHGLRIVEATLLAGRPNDPERRVSEDRIVGHSPTIGLHALEVPSQSLCRVQVGLRVPARGWLTAMLLSCLVVFGVLSSVVYNLFNLLGHRIALTDGEVRNNVVLILITTSAGVAALIALPEFGGLAGRMVGRLGMIGAVSTSLPIAAAAVLAYLPYPRQGGDLPVHLLLVARIAAVALLVLEFFLALIICRAWWQSHQDDRGRVTEESPWDMTIDHEPDPDQTRDFAHALDKYGFRAAAVGIRSAEGWHERYFWTDKKQVEATGCLRSLERLQSRHFAACRLTEAQQPGCAAGA